ncbi:hypothetical protein JHK82_037780 [Glycine max]|uniref:Uncharacterized protein n=2 Tax=Glycine subgen. Soja TaxID=1462606 RepID=A0A0R0GWI1_SOYBN|nr:hypothetical protein JHK87_037729 [Glycine soja]KAG4972112.1 hypothetical protein JHK85_038533 [Glycine max]KAG4978501.1 hypothetical protein JHK86_037975 [Glycine max]KAG5114511.1 hypothetical protein JHK82_037780 [Glycine max]KAG5131794.1 hypothetical protein JHK84_038191 [Glycine max]
MAQCISTSVEKGHQRRSSIGRRRFSATLKEYRGRFYILRRCLVMLLCWHEYE